MNIMFDMDGVLADFICGFTTLAAKMYGTPITTTHEQPKWDGFPGLTSLQIAVTWNRVKESTDFWANLGTLVGTQTLERINDLHVIHRVHFVTSRPGIDTYDQTVSWLESRGILTPQVLVVPNAACKGAAAAAINADYTVDDKAGNAVYVQYHVPGVKSYIIDRHYNQFNAEVIGSKVKRIWLMDEYLEDIEKHTAGLK